MKTKANYPRAHAHTSLRVVTECSSCDKQGPTNNQIQGFVVVFFRLVIQFAALRKPTQVIHLGQLVDELANLY